MRTKERKIRELQNGNLLVSPDYYANHGGGTYITRHCYHHNVFELKQGNNTLLELSLEELRALDLDNYSILVNLGSEERFILANYLSCFTKEYNSIIVPGTFIYACTKDGKLYPVPSNIGPVGVKNPFDKYQWDKLLLSEIYSLEELGISHIENLNILSPSNWQKPNYSANDELYYHRYQNHINK